MTIHFLFSLPIELLIFAVMTGNLTLLVVILTH